MVVGDNLVTDFYVDANATFPVYVLAALTQTPLLVFIRQAVAIEFNVWPVYAVSAPAGS
jgi:hypothetical protein